MGTGNPETMTLGLLNALKTDMRIVLQTGKVPAAEYIRGLGHDFETLDGIYDESEDFDDFNERAAEFLSCEDTLFLVLGQVSSNEALLTAAENPDIDVEVIPGLSIEGEAAAKALISSNRGLKCYDAKEFIDMRINANGALLIYAIDDEYTASEVILKLKRWYKPETQLAIINDGKLTRCALEDAQGRLECSYSCCIAIAEKDLDSKESYSYEDLKEVMIRLRDDFDGCPWDREQTHESLRRYLIEEAFETAEAIDRDDMFSLADELGDVLLQVMYHAQIADEMQDFDEYDVTSEICKKMINRHPHIFKNESGEDYSPENWEEIKKKEKKISSLAESLIDIPLSMDILLRAEKMLSRSERFGAVYEACTVPEIEDEAEAGRYIMSLIDSLRKKGICAETALATECARYKDELGK